MATDYEGKTDEAIAILEKAMKTKAKDTKARTDLHKKANAKLTDLQKHLAGAIDSYADTIEKITRTLEEAFGVASKEAKLGDREIVRGLRKAIRQNKDIPAPKGWGDNYDKAVKAVAEWDPKADNVDALKEGIKLLEGGKKNIETKLAARRKIEVESNKSIDEAYLDLQSLDDAEIKRILTPYFERVLELYKS